MPHQATAVCGVCFNSNFCRTLFLTGLGSDTVPRRLATGKYIQMHIPTMHYEINIVHILLILVVEYITILFHRIILFSCMYFVHSV
jgi:hypothetical protein